MKSRFCGAALSGDLVVEPRDSGVIVRTVGRVSSPRFVDRRKELLAIEAAVARTRDGSGSLVFVVEDFQWADRSTCDLFAFLLSLIHI